MTFTVHRWQADPDREARDWLLRLLEAEFNAEELAAWEVWLRRDENARAYDRVAALWSLTEDVAAAAPSEAEIGRDRYCGEVPVQVWRRRAALVRGAWMSAAACACAVMLGSGWFWWEAGRSASVEHIATTRSQHASRALSDGSHVDVAADTTLEVRYRWNRRDLVLGHGEALFKVSKNAHRPFTVSTPMLAVRSLGTAFDVDTTAERTTVTVLHGVVGVTPNPVSSSSHVMASNMIRVGARQRLVIENGAMRLTALGPADPTEPDWLTWRREYRHEPLRDVLADVNRYAKVPIGLQDESIGDLEYTGTVQLRDIDSWVLGVADAFNLSLSIGDDRMNLRKKVSRRLPPTLARAS
jgi:transmembrane sensor